MFKHVTLIRTLHPCGKIFQKLFLKMRKFTHTEYHTNFSKIEQILQFHDEICGQSQIQNWFQTQTKTLTWDIWERTLNLISYVPVYVPNQGTICHMKTDRCLIQIFNMKKKLGASQIYQRTSGFTTQLWYRFIRSPQSKETSSHGISSEVPKSSVTKLKEPQNAPLIVSTATNSMQHRLRRGTTCYFVSHVLTTRHFCLQQHYFPRYSQVSNAVTYCLHLGEPTIMCAISPTLHNNLLQTKILDLHRSRVSKFQGNPLIHY